MGGRSAHKETTPRLTWVIPVNSAGAQKAGWGVRTDETFELVSPATAWYFACMLGAFQVPFLGMLAIVLLSLAGHRTTVGQALLGNSAHAAHSFHRSPGLYGAGTVVYFLGSIVGWIDREEQTGGLHGRKPRVGGDAGSVWFAPAREATLRRPP